MLPRLKSRREWPLYHSKTAPLKTWSIFVVLLPMILLSKLMQNVTAEINNVCEPLHLLRLAICLYNNCGTMSEPQDWSIKFDVFLKKSLLFLMRIHWKPVRSTLLIAGDSRIRINISSTLTFAKRVACPAAPLARCSGISWTGEQNKAIRVPSSLMSFSCPRWNFLFVENVCSVSRKQSSTKHL